MGRLDGKVVVMTGTSSGVGAVSAKLFAAEGAKLVIGARRFGLVEGIAEEIRNAGGEVTPVALDISNQGQVEAAFATAMKRYGNVDVLAHIAGITDNVQGISTIREETLRKTIEINAIGTFRCFREAIKYMVPAGKGTIVAVGSAGGLYGLSGAGYAMSKGAMMSLVKNVSSRYTNVIRANAVIPGSIMTPMTLELDWDNMDFEQAGVITNHMFRDAQPDTAEEIANVLLFLSSDESAAIDGQYIVCDKHATP